MVAASRQRGALDGRALPRPGLRDERAPLLAGRVPPWHTEGALVVLTRRTRRDALPEHTQYADTGCEVHHSCLSCPLARCRYDEPGGARRLRGELRDRQIVALQRSGEAVNQIAQRFGVSRRTVFRALARGRQSADGER